MGRLKTFLPFLISTDKKPLYVNNNVVMEGDAATFQKPDGSPAHLDAAPTGWRDILVKYGRNTKYMGLFREFTVPLSFALDGNRILKDRMWNAKGIETQVFFSLLKLNRYETTLKYQPWYTGELDFSKFKQKKDRVDISAMEGGVSKYLKAYEGTTYEIPLATDPQALDVYMDGMPFTNRLEYLIFEEINQNIKSGELVAMGIVQQEGTSQGVVALDVQQTQGPISYPNNNYLLKSFDKNITAHITDGAITYLMALAAGKVQFIIIKMNELTGVRVDYLIYNNNSEPTGIQTRNFAFDIPMTAGDALYFERNQTGGLPAPYVLIKNGTFKINYEVTFTPTFCKALPGDILFQRIVSKMTNGMYYARSNFLSNLRDIVFTSGTGIRQNTNATIKISLEDFFKAVKPFMVGLGIENGQLIIEDLRYFFQQPQIIDLGIVDDVSIDVAEDLIYNTLKVGYKNNTYDNVNGTDEFNVTQQWTLPITKVTKELDLISSARADMTGIELTRLNLTGKTTTDSSSDNEFFILNINTVPETIQGRSAYRLFRKAYQSIEGLLHPNQAFNIELSPKRMLLRYLPFLSSILDRQFGQIIFQTGDKNAGLITIFPDPYQLIVESGSISGNSDKLFLPYYFNVTTEVPFNYTEIMNTNPYGKIKFTYKETSYTGYMFDGGIKPAVNDRQAWKLLACADNDMSKLI